MAEKVQEKQTRDEWDRLAMGWGWEKARKGGNGNGVVVRKRE